MKTNGIWGKKGPILPSFPYVMFAFYLCMHGIISIIKRMVKISLQFKTLIVVNAWIYN